MTLLQAYEERRLELGLKKQEVAARAGVTPTHLRRALIGKVAISPDLAAALERALEWPRGRVAHIAGGPDSAPSPRVDEPIPEGARVDPEVWAEMTEHERAQLARIVAAVRRRREQRQGA